MTDEQFNLILTYLKTIRKGNDDLFWLCLGGFITLIVVIIFF